MPSIHTPQIMWHSMNDKHSDRVYSLDFQRHGQRLATSGADEFIHIWRITVSASIDKVNSTNNGDEESSLHSLSLQTLSSYHHKNVAVKPTCISRLVGHEREVNSVRWNHDGTILASGGGDGVILLWQKSSQPTQICFGFDNSILDFEEYWSRVAHYRCADAINTICWSSCGTQLAAGCENGRIMIFDIKVDGTTSRVKVLEGHINIVQGISWDPLNEYIGSQGSDQTLRLWRRKTGDKDWKMSAVLKSIKDKHEEKIEDKSQNDDEQQKQQHTRKYKNLFYPESALHAFFRRLDWSPDGSIFVTPAGQQFQTIQIADGTQKSKLIPASYVFHRKLFTLGPFATHPCPSTIPLVVRFNPVTFSTVRYRKNISDSKNSKNSNLDIPHEHESWLFKNQYNKIQDVNTVTSEKISVNGESCNFSDKSQIKNKNKFTDEKSMVDGIQDYAVETYEKDADIFGGKKGQHIHEVTPVFVYAIGTSDGSVLLYNTQFFKGPIARFDNLHLSAITDAAWSDDGYILVVSSSDGYISFIIFDESELGSPLLPAFHYHDKNLVATTGSCRKRSANENKNQELPQSEPLGDTIQKLVPNTMLHSPHVSMEFLKSRPSRRITFTMLKS